jgi:hypothetical protein
MDAYVVGEINLKVASLITTFESTKKSKFSFKNPKVANLSKNI